jgi:hypothetical protein
VFSNYFPNKALLHIFFSLLTLKLYFPWKKYLVLKTQVYKKLEMRFTLFEHSFHRSTQVHSNAVRWCSNLRVRLVDKMNVCLLIIILPMSTYVRCEMKISTAQNITKRSNIPLIDHAIQNSWKFWIASFFSASPDRSIPVPHQSSIPRQRSCM